MSNDKVERMFSVLKNIKTEKRTRLSADHLNGISVDAPDRSAWDANGAVKLWWSAKTCCIVKDSRKTPESTHAAAEEESIDDNEEDDALVLDGWEDWNEQ